jgi:hypothetical protein
LRGDFTLQVEGKVMVVTFSDLSPQQDEHLAIEPFLLLVKSIHHVRMIIRDDEIEVQSGRALGDLQEISAAIRTIRVNVKISNVFKIEH